MKQKVFLIGVVPGRKEIPDTLQLTVSKVLEALHKGVDILA